MIPEFAAGFDGARVKVLCGTQARETREDRFYTLGVGVKVFPATWLSVSGYLPYRWTRAEYEPSRRKVETEGIGDPALSATFDLLEWLNPSMIVTRCPETGGRIIALKDDDAVVKAPHLVLAGGVAFPLGDADRETHGWVYPPQYQPGSGVWMTSAGLFYSQGIGPVTPGAGATYLFSGGENEAGYEKPDAVLLSGSLSWLFWYQRRGRVFAGINWLAPQGTGRQDGEKLEGSDRRLVSADLGVSFWVWSLPDANKIIAGVITTLPIDEGEEYTEPRLGAALGGFLTYGL